MGCFARDLQLAAEGLKTLVLPLRAAGAWGIAGEIVAKVCS